MCCLGPSLAGNPTQYVMEKCFHQAGWDSRFLSLQVADEDLSIAIDGMRAMDFCGAVITGPFQTKVPQYLAELTPDAKEIGAVNCLHRAADRHWLGSNTIGSSFLHNLKNVFDPQNSKVLLLHTGATARAIAFALARESISDLTIVGADSKDCEAFVETLQQAAESSVRFLSWEDELRVEKDVQLIVHAPEPGEVDPTEEISVVTETLSAEMLLVDMCLGSPTTAFLRSGLGCGCQVLHGQQMLVSQWVECVRLWTGNEPDGNVMREALEEYLGL